MTTTTEYIENIRSLHGDAKALAEALRLLRGHEALQESRFLEACDRGDGVKQLRPITEQQISKRIDMADCDEGPPPSFFYGDEDAQLYHVTVGPLQRHDPHPDGGGEPPINYGSAPLIANGKVVGTVLYTAH